MGVRSTNRTPNKGFGENKILDQHTVNFYDSTRVGRGTNPGSVFLASGGTITSGTGPAAGYTIHTFTSSDTFAYSGSATGKSVDMLLVGGGGNNGGGGGAVRYITSIPLPSNGGSTPVIIGDFAADGGVVAGNPSSAFGYTANGGGANPGPTTFPMNNGGVPGGGYGGLNHDSGPTAAGNGTQVDIDGNNY